MAPVKDLQDLEAVVRRLALLKGVEIHQRRRRCGA